ncbi:hypothetical protein DYB31_003761 [Aphanomyces astaci]|uniref:Kinesin motor domain-containing protein n=1 Tax=Aphanomyces astaci TaxID=112090 RepID=A0A397EU88_APHAT|nr:hypothetical protein DYB31_003761 [Aphanomyces astaci]
MDIASAAAIVNSINKLENKGKETVKVVVRCRPLFGKEIVEGRQSIVTMDLAAAVVSIKCPDSDQLKNFTFDSVYDENTVQRQFYDESGYPLVESIFEGYNGTIFAYGQTGCGKTHTMQGKDSPPELRGVIPHAFDHVFDNINADTEKEYMVRATYLEIYNEDIRDLLSDDSNKQKLELKESGDGGVYVKDLTEVVVRDVVSINKYNEGSSRSHSIFTIVVEVSEKVNGEDRFRAGKEGCKINLSLSALGNVISALVDGKGKHIPYRDSKLTRLLQDSLGGNTKTVMVAAISPADYNFEETLSTLRYANRAKNIKNKPTVNEDPKDAKLREYKAEIELLKQMLAQQKGGLVVEANEIMNRVPTPPRTTLSPSSEGGENRSSSSMHRSTTDRERELEAKSQELEEKMQREKEEIQRQFKVEQESIEKAKADAADMMHLARQMMAEARERELLAIREKEVQRTKEMEETKAKAAEMMRKAERMMDEAMARAAQPPKVKIVKEVVEVVREVVPDDHMKEKEALKEMNQTILNHRDKMAKELELTQLAMESHMREKSELATKLEKIGSQICGTKPGGAAVDAEVAILKQQVEFRRAQIKLKMKKKKEAQYEIAQEALQAEKQSVEEELKNAQEQAQVNIAAYKKKQSKYKAKLEAAKEEMADMHKEFERERDSLMDTIHQQTREVKLMEQLVELFLPQNELIKVWEKAVWLDDKEEYVPLNKIDAISSRGEDHGMELLPLNDVKTKLPSASSKSSRRDKPGDATDGTAKKSSASSSSSSRKKDKKKKDKQSRDDTLQNNLDSLGNSLEPLDESSAPLDQLVCPVDMDYQPRDRLQSRQGSRQGRRVADTKSSGLGETEDPPASRRRRKSSHKDESSVDAVEAKQKKKKKRDKDRSKVGTPPVSAPSLDVNNLLAHSVAAPSPEDPDGNDDMWEDFP